jgi:hypothetical protein
MFAPAPTRALLAIGPTLTTLLVWMFLPTQATLHIAMIAVLVAWSPLFISIPALLVQDARDAALPNLGGPIGSLVRGAALIPYMLIPHKSPARLEIGISLAGLALAAVLIVLGPGL